MSAYRVPVLVVAAAIALVAIAAPSACGDEEEHGEREDEPSIAFSS